MKNHKTFNGIVRDRHLRLNPVTVRAIKVSAYVINSFAGPHYIL